MFYCRSIFEGGKIAIYSCDDEVRVSRAWSLQRRILLKSKMPLPNSYLKSASPGMIWQIPMPV